MGVEKISRELRPRPLETRTRGVAESGRSRTSHSSSHRTDRGPSACQRGAGATSARREARATSLVPRERDRLETVASRVARPRAVAWPTSQLTVKAKPTELTYLQSSFDGLSRVSDVRVFMRPRRRAARPHRAARRVTGSGSRPARVRSPGPPRGPRPAPPILQKSRRPLSILGSLSAHPTRNCRASQRSESSRSLESISIVTTHTRAPYSPQKYSLRTAQGTHDTLPSHPQLTHHTRHTLSTSQSRIDSASAWARRAAQVKAPSRAQPLPTQAQSPRHTPARPYPSASKLQSALLYAPRPTYPSSCGSRELPRAPRLSALAPPKRLGTSRERAVGRARTTPAPHPHVGCFCARRSQRPHVACVPRAAPLCEIAMRNLHAKAAAQGIR